MLLAVLLLGCSGEAELEAPMLGDCAHCTVPSSGNGASGADASIGDAATFDGDAADFDAVSTSDAVPDALDIVDVLAPFPATD
jgi:hypothetical protein